MAASEAVDDFVGRALNFGELAVHVQRLLAEGGFAAVYEASSGTGKKYVVKKIIAQIPEVLHQTLREIEIHSQLKHPNIVELIAHKQFPLNHEATCFLLLMEYCPNGDLMGRLQTVHAQLPTRTIVNIMIPICSAIAVSLERELYTTTVCDHNCRGARSTCINLPALLLHTVT